MRHSAPNASLDHDACGVGFIAQLGGEATRDVVQRALVALDRLSHRGGVDSDGLSGDGAGLLLPIPRVFFRAQSLQLGISLPETFGLGMVFLPPGRDMESRGAIESLAQQTGLRCMGWRDVPVNFTILGSLAASTMPSIRQCFFESLDPAADIERQLFFLRKRVETEGTAGTYFCSLSSRTVVYKGLLTPAQFRDFYLDLTSSDFRAPFAIFHQRYSTNTQPSWAMAQPFRYVAHNGEINTISANRRWMQARERKVQRELETGEWFHALEDRVSDSASFDNSVEILGHRGYHIAAAMLRMVPPASESKKSEAWLNDFLREESFDQEPWDGPAALVFTDGHTVGAKLDRNGLRPLRYCITSDGLVIAGSEAGLTDLQDKEVIERQRLGPGEMFLVDPTACRCFLQADFAQFLPTRETRRVRRPVRLQPSRATQKNSVKNSILQPRRVAAALGWSDDQYRLLFQSLGAHAKEATWSMGDDAPPAFLSAMRRPLWDYCKQRFAQVTNPPIDPLREGHVMSLDVHLAKGLVIPSPLLDPGQIAALRSRLHAPVRSISFTFEAAGGVKAAIDALQRVRDEVSSPERRPPSMILLSDRGISSERAALPALLALAAAWKALVSAGACDVPLIIETGQVIETHHLAMLIAAGASAVCPYLALELSENSQAEGAARYREAVNVGLRKVLARMGICTVGSYRNSQLFEIVGLNQNVRDEFFEDAGGALGGKSLEELLQDSLDRHTSAFAPSASTVAAQLRDEGLYRFRQTGERHSSSPDLVRRMHHYVKSPTAENYRAYAELAETREPVAIRDLFDFAAGNPIVLEEVEPESAILARFTSQAMSLGALGPEAHRTLAIAMNRLGARSNTGEGGEDPDVYRSEPEAANRIKQVASARFGVTTEYLVRADELEIKMAQGSKPGEGGQLPAAKVTPLIARLRHAVAGMSLISPPPHHDIYSIEDLAQLIHDLRAVNPLARIGVKLVAGSGVGIIAAGVAKAGADVITISGFDGGTGASPLTSIKNTGLPWEVGLRESHNTLLRSGYRTRVRLRVDGGFKSGRDVIVAALLGADEFGFGTAALIAIGCIMARQCHLNTCPVGIATQNEELRARFEGKPEMVMSYFHGVAEEVREQLAQLGERSLADIVGQAERLQPKNSRAALSLGGFLGPSPESQEGVPSPASCEWTLDNMLIAHLDSTSAIPAVFPIQNSDRSVGAYLTGHILRRSSFAGLDDQQQEVKFSGTAGQSFGAFLIGGLTFRLDGEANDYVGKGLSGGTIAISAGADASRRGDLLVGNTVLYGATSGELYVSGRAGERFAVRNSGALTVVEGVGHHACEYMTAGVVIILGPTGMNLGSGMTGGLVYVSEDLLATGGYNREFVHCANACGPTAPGEEASLRRALEEHVRQTSSPRAMRLLEAKGPLPLLRLEPVHLPCSLAQTWSPLLERWEKRATTVGMEATKFLRRMRLDSTETVDESVA
jgi:glutamate synthase domain-containing protein 2/glutamate synthase domain-containing protein 1/glutamate synthase domain-containing protein 3